MEIKYPIEIELSSFCSFNCIYCINSNIKLKKNIKLDEFDLILNYLFKNIDNILYINFSGIGDIFLHKNIDVLLLNFIKKFKGTNIDVLISNKGTNIKQSTLSILKKFKSNQINLNISIGIYSMDENIHNHITQTNNTLRKIINFIFLLKNIQINYSLELILTSYNYKDLKKFQSFCKILNIEEIYYKLHNFGGRINIDENINFNIKNLKNNCDFNGQEIDKNNFYKTYSKCNFIPFISSDLKIYLCSLSSHYCEIYDFREIVKKFPNYINLVKDLKQKISFDNCGKCSLYR